MFERYTIPARRVIFFARYEASEYGSSYIFPEHLFLGLVREARVSIAPSFGGEEQLEAVRTRVANAIPRREKISTAVDLPLDDSSKRVLAYAAEEAELAHKQWIDSGHLLLGLMRERPSALIQVPEFANLDLQSVREAVERMAPAEDAPASTYRTGGYSHATSPHTVVVARTLFWPGFVVGAISGIVIGLVIKGC
jgi:ATP-dependent Clp protease ATP-binding subunit ClpC